VTASVCAMYGVGGDLSYVLHCHTVTLVCYVMLCYVVSCHIMPCYIEFWCVMSCQSCYAMSCHGIMSVLFVFQCIMAVLCNVFIN